jgi:two-component system LytT family response regulator
MNRPEPVRVLIADDEPLARRKLRGFLTRHDGFELVGEAADGSEAATAIADLEPDLVLLDIHMPGLDGFEVLSACGEAELPSVVFVTAYDEHAVQAFDVGAIDYLLKPIDAERFSEALDRVLERRRSGERPHGALAEALARLGARTSSIERFLVRKRTRSLFVNARDVVWIEGAGNYVRLHVEGAQHSIRATLSELERRLDASRFVRIHKSTIVTLERIDRLEPWSHGDQLVILTDGTNLRMSRRYRDRIPAVYEG